MKRYLSLILILCLLLSCAVFPASAAKEEPLMPFADAESINHYAECAIFYALGVVSGNPNGVFQPQRNLTRAEVAVLVSRLDSPEEPINPVVASDVYPGHWAENYIGYMVEMGYMTLQTGNRFMPGVAITVRDFCRVMLRLIGYENVTDDVIEELIEQADLLSGFHKGLDSFVTRDDACILMYNAASCFQIQRWENGQPVYYTDMMLNPTSLLERRFGLTRYTELVTANEYADIVLAGSHLEQGYTQLAEHRAFAIKTGLEYVGRRVDVFVRNGEVIGLPHIRTDETCLSFSNYLDYEAFLLNNGFDVDAQTNYYFNYESSDRYCLIGNYDRCEIICVDSNNDRVFDLVLVVACEAVELTSLVPIRLRFQDGEELMITEEVVRYGELKSGETVYAVRVSGIWHIFAEQ